MKLRSCSLNNLKKLSKKKKMICFGAGEELLKFFHRYAEDKLEQDVSFIVDNNKEKENMSVSLNGRKIIIKRPNILTDVDEKNFFVLITARRFREIFCQIQNIRNNDELTVYRLPTKKSYFSYIMERIIQYFPLSNYILIRYMDTTNSNNQALAKYIRDNQYFRAYKIIWLCSEEKIPSQKKSSYTKHEKFIKESAPEYSSSYFEIFKYYWYYGRAKYLFYENRHLKKLRSDQIMIYLNHGSPPIKRTKGIIKLPQEINYALSPSEYSTDIISEQYSINKERIIVCGAPRTDIFFEDTPLSSYVRDIRYSGYKKIILWAPTFRQRMGTLRVDSQRYYPYGIPILNTEQDVSELRNTLKELSVLLLIKPHKLQDIGLYKIIQNEYIKIVTDEELEKNNTNIYETMKFIDALLTDYSTISFDFMLLDRPIGYTVDDMEEYKLGFSVENVQELMPGDRIICFRDLREFIENISNGIDRFKKERNKVNSLIHENIEGKNSEQLCRMLNIVRI